MRNCSECGLLLTMSSGDVVKNARVRQKLYNATQRADDRARSSLLSPAVSVDQVAQVNGDVSASPAPSTPAFASGIDRDRRSVESSIRSIPMTSGTTELDTEVGASTLHPTASLATPNIDDFRSFEASAFVEAATEVSNSRNDIPNRHWSSGDITLSKCMEYTNSL